MGFWDDRENVDQYIEMAAGYDGRELVEILKGYLPVGSSVLELGMGPGVDLDILARYFHATGSDNSRIFIEMYRKNHPDADLLRLDAETLETDRTFDCIYSNKVLMHLSKDAIRRSFRKQRQLLSDHGIALHTFWFGQGEEHHQGLRFVYFDEHTLSDIAGPGYEVIETKRYTEMEESDSLYLLLRKTSGEQQH